MIALIFKSFLFHSLYLLFVRHNSCTVKIDFVFQCLECAAPIMISFPSPSQYFTLCFCYSNSSVWPMYDILCFSRTISYTPWRSQGILFFSVHIMPEILLFVVYTSNVINPIPSFMVLVCGISAILLRFGLLLEMLNLWFNLCIHPCSFIFPNFSFLGFCFFMCKSPRSRS